MTMGFLGGRIGPLELVLILLIVLVLFGARKLPDVARSIGRSLSEFKKGRAEGERDLKKSGTDETEPKPGDGA